MSRTHPRIQYEGYHNGRTLNILVFSVAEEIAFQLSFLLPATSVVVSYDDEFGNSIYTIHLAWEGKEFFTIWYYNDDDERDKTTCMYCPIMTAKAYSIKHYFQADALMPLILANLRQALCNESSRMNDYITRIQKKELSPMVKQ